MSFPELFIIAIGLSMDAFAVSICKGASVQKFQKKNVLITGAYFGGFQAIMPFLGYFLGTSLQSMVENVDHWIAFALLGLIGANMIRESMEKTETMSCSFSFKTMFPLAVATSIDALAVGITFAFLKVQIIPAVCFIGIVTFVLSAIGVLIGRTFAAKYKSKAELAGGIVLILMGTKILLQHLGILNI
jgi:manganese efflux pump family protein